MSRSPLVSLVVVHYHTPLATLLCLRSLRKYTSLPTEIVVVDNSPHTQFSQYLCHIPWIRYFPNTAEKPSHRNGLDLGIRHCQGEWYAVLHSDTYVYRDRWLQTILERAHAKAWMIASWERFIWPVRTLWDKLHCWIKRRRLRRRWGRRTPKLITHLALFRPFLFREQKLSFSLATDEEGDDCGLAIQRYVESQGKQHICWLFREFLGELFYHFEGASLNATTGRTIPAKRKRRILHFYRRPEIQAILTDHSFDEVSLFLQKEYLFPSLLRESHHAQDLDLASLL